MKSQNDATLSEQEIEAEVLLRTAQELARLAEEAAERARAAWARIPRPMPLLDGLTPNTDGEDIHR